jgi:nicotinamidase-related amidase
MSRKALLILDLQKGCREATSCKETFDKVVQNINGISQTFRKANLPVVVIQHIEMGTIKEDGFDNVDELLVSESDYRIEKNYYNAFWKTDLEEMLKKENIDTVIVCGFAAEFCVAATCNGALERGFNVYLLQGAVAGFTEEGIDLLQKWRPLMTVAALKNSL